MTSPRPTKILISAGESSGDIHGAALVRAARGQGRDWRFSGLGGDRLAGAGVRLLGHIRETAVMGLVEVLGSLRRLLAVRNRLKRALELERPDLLVLIDAPDFNLPLARYAHSLGLPVVYYICPSVWAWRAGRLKTLAAHTRRRVVLFPFEKKFYEERGVSADWVGHPIPD
ncbi:MAG: lipid-A-disaccharide synthase, partial [Candidatus Adiutrix sp.]|nr:lipid-A-disaccharide synthase [Candidatus Adiutrix sp.]